MHVDALLVKTNFFKLKKFVNVVYLVIGLPSESVQDAQVFVVCTYFSHDYGEK